jgi:mono/diheme cytochrome c family protein
MRSEILAPTWELAGVIAAALALAMPVMAQQATATPEEPTMDVRQLFASTCGFCHSDGGKAAGRGPQLMHTQRDDDFIRNRIAAGKPGAMPAFGEIFDGPQIEAIVKYIRELEPDRG